MAKFYSVYISVINIHNNSFADTDNHDLCNSKDSHPNVAFVNDNSLTQLSLINELNQNVDNLKQQSDNLNERLKKAEQEKEHWKVEYQLVQMKHDKLKDKFEGKKCRNDFRSQVTYLRGYKATCTFICNGTHIVPNLLSDCQNKEQGDGDCLEDNTLDLGIINSEDKFVYENRISDLVTDRLLADSKAAHFYLECVALQKRVQSREKKKVICDFVICL